MTEYKSKEITGPNGLVTVFMYRITDNRKPVFVGSFDKSDVIDPNEDPRFADGFVEREKERIIEQYEEKLKIKNDKLKAWRDKQPQEYRDKENKKRKARRAKEDKYERQIKNIERSNYAFEEYHIKKMFREDEELQQKRKEYKEKLNLKDEEMPIEIKKDYALEKRVQRRKQKILDNMEHNIKLTFLEKLFDEALDFQKEYFEYQNNKTFRKNMQDSLICIDQLEKEIEDDASNS